MSNEYPMPDDDETHPLAVDEPVEACTRYTTMVRSLPRAFEFIMKYVDRVELPHIEIGPRMMFDYDQLDDEGEPLTYEAFEVMVEGRVPAD